MLRKKEGVIKGKYNKIRMKLNKDRGDFNILIKITSKISLILYIFKKLIKEHNKSAPQDSCGKESELADPV